MVSNQLPDEYRQIFESLKDFVSRATRQGLRKQSIRDIEDFARQYLTAIGILSRLKANPSLAGNIPSLQRVLLDANHLLYPEPVITKQGMLQYCWTTVPAQLWLNRGYYLLAAAICGGCAILGFLIVVQDFEMAKIFMPASLRSSHELESYLFSPQAQSKMLHAGRTISENEKSLFAVALMINNIQVALICFTMGAIFALPTLLVLIQTGLMLGTLPALFYGGDLYGLGAWLLPHGIPEVTAILLAGGAGLKLGLALLLPSPAGLGAQFRVALKQVVGTVVICILMLIWAGLVESFIRQSFLNDETRYLISALSIVPIILLFFRAYSAYHSLGEGQIPLDTAVKSP